jgi:hypothetical protein
MRLLLSRTGPRWHKVPAKAHPGNAEMKKTAKSSKTIRANKRKAKAKAKRRRQRHRAQPKV